MRHACVSREGARLPDFRRALTRRPPQRSLHALAPQEQVHVHRLRVREREDRGLGSASGESPPSSLWGDGGWRVAEHDASRDRYRTYARRRRRRRRSAAGAGRGRRRALVWTLVVLASVIGLGSILTTWVDRQMLDNQSWKDASARLIENPEVQDALSVFLVNEL